LYLQQLQISKLEGKMTHSIQAVPKVAVVYHSGYGHTGALAAKVAQGVTDAGADAVLLPIDNAGQDFEPVLQAVSRADAVVFGSPTYMGDVSAAFKAFAEASAKVFKTRGWQDKLAAGFTVSHSFDGDKGRTIASLATLAAQHGMVWVSLGLAPPGVTAAERGPETLNRVGGFLGLQAQADNAAPADSPPEGDRETARLLGVRVAEAARRWGAGKTELLAEAA
jgi:NAD(P)H dehydrogenase (quinone)